MSQEAGEGWPPEAVGWLVQPRRADQVSSGQAALLLRLEDPLPVSGPWFAGRQRGFPGSQPIPANRGRAPSRPLGQGNLILLELCVPITSSFFKSSTEDMLTDFRERKGEKHQPEREMDWLPSVHALTGDRTHHLSV